MTISCCKDCVAPKRHIGCHAVCPEYLAESFIHNAEREARNRQKEEAFHADNVNYRAARKRMKNSRRRR